MTQLKKTTTTTNNKDQKQLRSIHNLNPQGKKAIK